MFMRGRFLKLFNIGLQFLLLFLPWSTFISVFLGYKLQIPGANFIKEGILFIMLISLGFLYFFEFQKKGWEIFKKNWLIVLILSYILILSIITLFTTGIRGLIFGGRYDFVFLIVFLITYLGFPFLERKIGYYLKIFLISATLMLIFSIFLKFPLSEELLLHFGFSASASMWDFGGAPPIFHGIDGAGVRRFQGLLDGPNTMGAFLILFSGIFLYYFRFRKDWYFVLGFIIFIVMIFLHYTYSRSAVIGLIFAGIVSVFGVISILWKNYKKQMIALIGILIFSTWAISLKYSGTGENIIGREGSTRGHAERMLVGVNRFLDHPLGQGLGSAGPAYRHVFSLHQKDRKEVEEQDRFYIPESWYIQQFIEGGIVGGILFLGIMAIIFFSLFSINSIIAGIFSGIGAMNLFLHTFESSVISWLLFIFIALFLAYAKHKKERC